MIKQHSAKIKLLAGMAVAFAGYATVGEAAAQDGVVRRHVVRAQAAPPDAPAAYRGLTITRPPDAGTDLYSPDDIYTDGPVRYNDVRDFSPFPYADSGRQLPFGLDGIGGYGSDLGFNEGQDAAIYDRGAFNRAAR